jgi:hypothetical protein
MDLLWIALFGLLSAGILGLLSVCDRWLAPAPAASFAATAPNARPGNDAKGSTK